MTITPISFTAISRFLSSSLRKKLILTLFFASFVPLAFLIPSIGENSWNSVYHDNLEKHKLLASSLIEPIQLNIENYQKKLELLDRNLQSESFDNKQNTKDTINKFTNKNEDIVSVSFLLLSDINSHIIEIDESLKKTLKATPKAPAYISNEIRYQKYGKDNFISPVQKSSLSNQPIILIRHQVLDGNSNKIGTLFAEISPKFVQKLCSNISFGDKGQCAVVDNQNKVVAHSNKAWVSQIKSLHNNKLVQELKTSYLGSLEYISSTDQTEMIGGYAKVKNLDWGIIVTRPKSEIVAPLNAIKIKAFILIAVGLAIALALAIFAVFRITRPLNVLTDKAKVLAIKQDTYSLGKPPKNSSADIQLLWESISDLFIENQELSSDSILLEATPKKDIRKVMATLREQIIHKANNIDPETGLTNTACFLEELRKSLLIYKGETAGLIIIEVDNYKPLIARGNIELSNHIINHVAQILNASKRNDDMVARYGDEDRFVIFINDCTSKSLQGMAKKLRSLVEVSPILWKDDNIFVNLSTGLISHKITEETKVMTLMSAVENALETTKSKVSSKTSSTKKEALTS